MTLEANRSLPTDKSHHIVTFNWQSSLDGSKTWTSAPSTPLASTELAGLPSATTVTFRVSVTIAKTAGPWSQPVSLLVH